MIKKILKIKLLFMLFGVWCLFCLVYVYRISGPNNDIKVIGKRIERFRWLLINELS